MVGVPVLMACRSTRNAESFLATSSLIFRERKKRMNGGAASTQQPNDVTSDKAARNPTDLKIASRAQCSAHKLK